jgi:hypothetical protein
MSSHQMHIQLQELNAERALASLGSDPAGTAALDREIAVMNEAYVGAAVTEIATFRAELSGPQIG